MRNRLFIVLIAVLSLVAAACGSSTDAASEVVDAVEDAAEVEETESEESTEEAPVEEEPAEEEAPAEEEPAEEEAPAEEEPAEEEAPAEEEPAEEEPAEEEAPAEEEIPAAEIDGMAIYESNCARCHSSDGSGGRGANIQGISEEQPETTGGIEIVTNGGRGMPSFSDDLTAEEIEAVVNYVWDTF